MRWHVGILCWNAPDDCRETLNHILSGLVGANTIWVLDNGSSPPLPPIKGAEIVRSDVNLGAGGGVGRLATHMLDQGADAIVFVEDDWTLEYPLDLRWLEPIVSDPDVGQVRLGVRRRRPPDRYWTYGLEGKDAELARSSADSPFHSYLGGEYQRAQILWSNNPFACSRDVAARVLTAGFHELAVARKAWPLGLVTISTTPGHFRHRGSIRDRRDPGWKR